MARIAKKNIDFQREKGFLVISKRGGENGTNLKKKESDKNICQWDKKMPILDSDPDSFFFFLLSMNKSVFHKYKYFHLEVSLSPSVSLEIFYLLK